MQAAISIIGPILYMACFAAILGGAFAMMSQTLRSASRGAAPRRRHPEAPSPGEEVLVVDLSRERLEQLYAGSSSTGHGA